MSTDRHPKPTTEPTDRERTTLTVDLEPTTWTVDQVRQLGLTTDLATAAEIIGIGRTLAYELAREGLFPVRILRIRRRVLVRVADLLTFLGVD